MDVPPAHRPNLLFLKRSDVAALLTLDDCIPAVEDAFRARAEGRALPSELMHIDADGGEFHIKGGGLTLDRTYVALKANSSFFGNRELRGLPNIQGMILLFDAENGVPLAVMDSIEITILRTGAATAAAAARLARPESETATICGCGSQGRIQLAALRRALPRLARAHAYDANLAAAEAFAAEASGSGFRVEAAAELEPVARRSDVIVTCTPSKSFFLKKEHVRPGTFIAAVGADSSAKQELEPALVAGAKVVADILDQCVRVGEVHHAIAAGLMTARDVHGELGDVIAGRVPGRSSAEEIIVFDATGTALQDVAAAVAAYRKAVRQGRGSVVSLQE
jgi:ornithine cyclodeaminase/alanine dehydrogenase